MNDKPDGSNKPFYEDILSKRKRPSHKKGDAPRRPRAAPLPHANNEIAESQRRFASEQTGTPGREGYQGRDDSRPRAPREGYQGRDDSRPRAPREGYQGRDDSRPRAPREGSQSRDDSRPRAGTGSGVPYKGKRFAPPPTGSAVFGSLSAETKALLNAFPEIVQSVFPLDSKKIQALPNDIRELSHELTDERSERRVGYMNEPAVLGAYIRYYQWWNLVRLTRIFASLPLELSDGDAAVDLGSGPLTLPIALWMARPDLRTKKILWYCVDISQGALAAGEELFLSLAAKTGNEPWEIVRIKGECGVSLRRKVALVAKYFMVSLKLSTFSLILWLHEFHARLMSLIAYLVIRLIKQVTSFIQSIIRFSGLSKDFTGVLLIPCPFC